MRLYCIFDEKARSVCAVFQSLSDEAAARSFEHLITAPEDNVFTLSFSDFSVKFIGDFNESSVGNFHTVLHGSSFSDAVIASKRIERQHLIAEYKSLKDIRIEDQKESI